MSLLYTIGNLLVLATLIITWRRRVAPESRSHFLPGVLIKLLAGVVLGALYMYYYRGGDTLVFFRDAEALTTWAKAHPVEFVNGLLSGRVPISLVSDQPRPLFFVGLVSCINLLTGNSYWLTSLWLSFCSFAATWYLVRTLHQIFPDARAAASAALLFFPSVVFWSSGVMKESLAFGALCVLTALAVRWLYRLPLRTPDAPWALVAVVLLLLLKYYWAAVFFPCFVTSAILSRVPTLQTASVGRLITCWVALFAVLVTAAMLLHPNFYPQNFLTVIKTNHDALVAFTTSGLYIHYYQLNESWGSMLLNAPWALVSGLLRPFLFEARSVFQALQGLENLALLVLLVFGWQHWRLPAREHRLAWLATLTFIGVLCVLLALSTPNLGTLSRYRIAFLPFFVFLLLMNTPAFRGRSFRKIFKDMNRFGSTVKK
jgi:hypothetical protein